MNPLIASHAHGYYEVGDQIYFNKLEALHYATKTNQQVSWNFHNEVYSKIDWTQRPAGDLRTLYKERAQQIRDEYDYVIVNFGGGQDSWTVLNSFLSNNIHVDEVYTRWNFAERKYRDADPNNTHESNLGSEFEYATLPVLEHIKKNYPRTNVVIDDFSECFESDFTENTILASNTFHSMGTYYRYGRKSQQEIEVSSKNKKVAVVLGHDKICVAHNRGNKNWYAYFIDVPLGTDNDLSRTNEFFYWTPKFPSIPVLQAHCLIDELEAEQNYVKSAFSDDLRRVYAKACYPDYNIETFQAGKPYGTRIRASESWIMKYNPRYYESWKWNVDQLFNGISDDHLRVYNSLVVGTKFSATQTYLVRNNANQPN